MKRLLGILAVLLVVLFIADRPKVQVPKIPKNSPIHSPVTTAPNPTAASQKISNRVGHLWRWLTSSTHDDGRRMLIYVGLAATVAGAALRRSGAKAAHIGLAAALLVLLAEPLFVGFLGFDFYVKTSNWQYTNFLIIGAAEAIFLAMGYLATPTSR